MPEDLYVVAIALLLPLTASLLVTQQDPYQALVIRGILGAIAALVYALFGAADVALTEALVGTMLSITLYAIAVRSSMSMRLGVLDAKAADPGSTSAAVSKTGVEAVKALSARGENQLEPVLVTMRSLLKAHHVRLEVVPYATPEALRLALQAREVHTICLPEWAKPQSQPYHVQTRLRRLYDILQPGLTADIAALTYWQTEAQSDSNGHSDSDTPEPVEV
jgi:putative multicomponent Na+:H+ antiporter subunit B